MSNRIDEIKDRMKELIDRGIEPVRAFETAWTETAKDADIAEFARENGLDPRNAGDYSRAVMAFPYAENLKGENG